MKLTKINDYTWKIEKEKNMKVPGIIYASEKIIKDIKKDKTINQIINVASLPGIIKASYAMPDAHQGYGFSIGGVAGFDIKNGIISPGGVGFDINCGVRLIKTNLTEKDIINKKQKILNKIFDEIPIGLGNAGKLKFNNEELTQYLKYGAKEAVKQGYGWENDLENIEENGQMQEADPQKISKKAYKRGKPQLGSLGAGNHFIEIQKVETIYNPKIAKLFGIQNKNQIVIMIHTGSRGLGHQIASDYIRLMEDTYNYTNLKDKNLIYAPFNDKIGKDYYKAMCCAANYAWANRQIITHKIRKVFSEIFKKTDKELEMNIIYDLSHNIAKIETHTINNKPKQLIIHRKGATRCFGTNKLNTKNKYKTIGQPVIIPGSMGTASYLLIGTNNSEDLSFASTAHGAGRIMSRYEAIKTIDLNTIKKNLSKDNIEILSASKNGIIEEAPQVYKDIDEIINISEKLQLTKTIIKLKPIAVLKG
jgi:tRNA-splicing ligase RtcB (3'-phosphate/5'-hydroxy nucleic acid ligase)